MFFIGIDIAKRSHQAAVTDVSGNIIIKPFNFKNSSLGFNQFLSVLESNSVPKDDCIIGLESTGHYWYPLYFFLVEQKFNVKVFNPIQTAAFREITIRKVKNDNLDSIMIADFTRFGRYSETHIPSENMLALKNLSRFRLSVSDICGTLKKRTIVLLDQAAANNSIGISYAVDTFSFQIKQLIEQIEFMENQLSEIDAEMAKLLALSEYSVITTISGIGPTLGSIIVSEIGDIERFETSSKLVAYAGLDASVKQSGEFNSSQNKISKRGSPYLRRALWMAAFMSLQCDPALYDYYSRLRARGKSHRLATTAVARKLCIIVWAIMKSKLPYSPNI